MILNLVESTARRLLLFFYVFFSQIFDLVRETATLWLLTRHLLLSIKSSVRRTDLVTILTLERNLLSIDKQLFALIVWIKVISWHDKDFVL